MRKIWETGIILFSAMGFWGMIYPDLCFTEGVCSAVCEEAEGTEDGFGTGANGHEAEAGENNSGIGTGINGSGAGTGVNGSGVGTGANSSRAGTGENNSGYYAGEEAESGTSGQSNGQGNEENGMANAEADMFTRICSAKPGQIRIKSKFLEAIGLGGSLY